MPARSLRLAIVVASLVPAAAVVALPGTGKLAVVLVSLAVLAAVHGYGRLVAAWSGDEDAPVGLVMAWGVAGYLAIAGAAIAIGVFGPGIRIGVIAAGGVLGAGWLWANAGAVTATWRRPRLTTVLVLAFAVAVVGLVTLAAAGRWSGPFTDGETSYLAQLRRLDDTGRLADGFGFPRAGALGGQIALAALAGTIDPHASYLVDRGILLAIVILLGIAAVPRSPRATLVVAATLPLALTAVSEYLTGMAPYGSLIVLVVATTLTFERAVAHQSSRTMLLAVLTAAAASTIAHPAALFGFGVIAAAGVQASRWELGGSWWRRRAAMIGLAVVGPYLLAALQARLSSPRPSIDHAFPAAIAIGAGVGVVLMLLTVLALPGRPQRAALLSAAVSVIVAGAIAPSVTTTWHYAVPIAVAVLLVTCLLALAEQRVLARTVVAATAAVGLLAATRFQSGSRMLGWRVRATQLVDDARAVGELAPGATSRLASSYAAAQAAVPAGARLAIWVDRPDLVQYDRNPVTDLRSGAARRLSSTLPRLPLEYVLVDQAAPGDAWRSLVSTTVQTYAAAGLIVLAVER